METLLPIHQGHTLINYGTPYPFGRILDGILKDKWRICKYSHGKLSKTHCRHGKSQMKKEQNVPYGIVYGKPDIFYKIDIMGTCIYKAPVALVVKNPPGNAGDLRDLGLIPALGRSPGGGHGNPLQY